jgi:N-acetylmuramoyl-L-alanine amidase
MTEQNKLQGVINHAEAENDLETLDRLLAEGFEEVDEAPASFSPRVQMRAGFEAEFASDEAEGGLEGALAVNWLNRISRARRRVLFNIKTSGGFDGIILAEEGDSWTQYPLLLEDIVDHIDEERDIAIFSVGDAGDTVENMVREKEYLHAMAKSQASGMILSAGGNDVVGDGALREVLLQYKEGKQPKDLVDAQVLKRTIDTTIGHYRTIVGDIVGRFPHAKIFGHGYDVPYPREGGKRLGAPMESKGIPLEIGRGIIRLILEHFNDALAQLQTEMPDFIYTDLRGIVDRGPNSWFDELHPRNAGYGRAADAIQETIRIHLSDVESNTASVSSTGARNNGVERAAATTVVLDPGHGGTRRIGGSSPNNAKGPAGTLEKTLTLDVARRARSVLQDRGYTVVMTRDSDVNLGLANRAQVAKTAKAAVFVSLHFNGFNGSVQGTETFVHTRGSAMSSALCRAVQAEVVDALGHRDRNAPSGVKTKALGVLRPDHHHGDTAAVLHEFSFMDVAGEETRLLKVSYRQKAAVALADGIEGFLSSIGSGVESNQESELEDGFEIGRLDVDLPLADSEGFGGHRILDTSIAVTGGGVERALSAPFVPPWLKVAAERVSDPGMFGDLDDINEASEVDKGGVIYPDEFGTDAQANLLTLQRVFGGVESASFDYDAFDSFIHGLGLRHFQPIEFLTMGGGNASGSCAGKNRLPPKSEWPNLANTARMIDEIRERLGAPVNITSAYRSPAYNSCIGGATSSYHKSFKALDWVCSSGTARDWHRVAKEVRSSTTAFRGGIGLYIGSNFVHIDTRGSNADWTNS